MPLTVIVTGTRDPARTDTPLIWAWLDALSQAFGRLRVVQGGADGADYAARKWVAVHPTHALKTYDADWAVGPWAGPHRNRVMVETEAGSGAPVIGLVHSGGDGTANCRGWLRRCGVPVIDLHAAPPAQPELDLGISVPAASEALTRARDAYRRTIAMEARP